MRTLPTEMMQVLYPRSCHFSQGAYGRTSRCSLQELFRSPPGKRTVSSVLRVMDLDHRKEFNRYHRVLNRASWSSREASGILLR